MSVKDRPRLGRGLKALISSPVEVEVAPKADSKGEPGILMVPLDRIDANPYQPREAIDPATLAELVTSIRTSGVLQPVLLRPKNGRYQLIAGHRRTEAARQAGLAQVPAVVRADATDELQAEWALIENIQRQDLNPIERARAYKAYVERFKLTHAQAAERLGEDRTTITNFLRLLELNEGIQTLIGRGILSAGHAKVLAGITDRARQDSLANKAVVDGLSVRKLEEIAQQPVLTVPTASTTTEVSAHTRSLVARSAHIVELEQELSRKLGTKLRILPAKRKNTGKIIIQYFSLDEFDRIVERIESEPKS